jgi:hypothetical protein
MSFLINLKKQLQPKKGGFDIIDTGYSFNGSEYNAEPTRKGLGRWWLRGKKDDAPFYLERLAEGSAVHNAILKTKSLMTSGDGYTINGSEPEQANLSAEQKSAILALEENKYGGVEYQEFKNIISDDYQIQGQFAYVVTWNMDFTKIASYKPLLTKWLWADVAEYGKPISKWYYFEGDINKARAGEIREYYVYDKNDRNHYDQIVFEKDGTGIYGTPSYHGAIRWISIDIEMGVFHESNIKNGMNPGLHFKFFTVPETEEQKQSIINDIKNRWMGALNTGKFVPTFSPSKDLATEVTPIETSNLDKQLLNLTELCDRKILSGHQLTSPLLAGISVSGQIGGNVELQTSFSLFNNMVMAKSRQKIDNSLQKHIFDVNVPGVKIETKPFNPLINA